MPKPLSPGRQGTGNPLHVPWQRRWRRQPVLATWHCGAHRSPASLSCASSPAPPSPAIQPQLGRAQQRQHCSPSPPHLVALEEKKKTRSCFCIHWYTPKWTARKKGERRHRQVLDSLQRCRLSWLALEGCAQKALGSSPTGVTACQSHYCSFLG